MIDIETQMISFEKMLKAPEIAVLLNISRSMAYYLIKVGEIRSIQIGSARRVRASDLQVFIEENLSPSPQ